MSHPIIFQPRWFSPVLKTASMWRVSPARNSAGKLCIGGPRPFIFLAGGPTEVVPQSTIDHAHRTIDKILPATGRRTPQCSFDLSADLSEDAIVLAQQELAGLTQQTVGQGADNVQSVPMTLMQAIAGRLVEEPLGYQHGALAQAFQAHDTLDTAAAQFIAFLDAMNLTWTHVVASGREALLATYIATHHPERIGSLVLIDTAILPDTICRESDVFTHGTEKDGTKVKTEASTEASTPLSRFIDAYPTMAQIKYVLHPILFATTEAGGRTSQLEIDRHKRTLNFKKVIKLKCADGDALQEAYRGGALPENGQSTLAEPLSEALVKWAERFDLMSYVNRKWAAAKNTYHQELEKQAGGSTA